MQDVSCRLLVFSNPYVSSISECENAGSNKEPLMKKVLSLRQKSNLQQFLNTGGKKTNSKDDTDTDYKDNNQYSSSDSYD